jgi:two-component system sensor histidine kinase PhoQ
LKKVYADREITFRIDVEPGLRVSMDEADLMEITGNLIENACKWCRKVVRVSARGEGRSRTLSVCDDGPGIDPARARDVLGRGVRADQRTPGHGIGLAVVRDIVASYGGDIQIATSAEGGAEIRVTIAGR